MRRAPLRGTQGCAGEAAAPDQRAASTFSYNEHYEADGAIIYKHACALGCEGIVSKRLGSPSSLWPSRLLGEGQEPSGSGGHARGRGGKELTAWHGVPVAAVFRMMPASTTRPRFWALGPGVRKPEWLPPQLGVTNRLTIPKNQGWRLRAQRCRSSALIGSLHLPPEGWVASVTP